MTPDFLAVSEWRFTQNGEKTYIFKGKTVKAEENINISNIKKREEFNADF